MTTIRHLGTFDVENYGDLLYPLVFQHILKTRAAGLSVRQYSFLKGRAPQEAGFETHTIQSLFARGSGASKIVVGGGDILRTDWGLVAEHYAGVHGGYYGRLRRASGASGLASRLLLRIFPRPAGESFHARRFRARSMNYSAAGPFLINPARLTEGSEVSYLSCGVPHDFAPSEMDEVRHTFEAARFIYLRDEQSAEKLRRAGVRREIHVAPDLIVLLSEQFNHAAEARKGREILLRFGVDVARPVLCFQSKPFPGFREEEIAKELERYRQRARAEVALLPLGFCHGDREFLRRLAKQSGGALKYIDVYSVFDAMRVIAACKMFVGTSLHGNVTAFSFGIPHLFGPLPVDKAEGFWNVTNLPPELKLRSWRELNDKLEFASEFDPAFFSGLAREASLKVHGAVDELLERLLN